jgi:pyridoxine/pyridoxamine 5'-phosphate oxidase
MEVSSFAEIEAAFRQRIEKMVWCNVATVDTQGRPRSRILHPLWEGPIGWITTRHNMHKAKHSLTTPTSR